MSEYCIFDGLKCLIVCSSNDWFVLCVNCVYILNKFLWNLWKNNIMKLRMLPKVLFDEFPSDTVCNTIQSIFLYQKGNFNFNLIFFYLNMHFQTVKYCFFTQPKYPTLDYTEYSDNVMYCGSKATLLVMQSFKVSPHIHLSILSIWFYWCDFHFWI